MGGCFSSQNEEAEKYISRKVRPSDEDRGRYVGEPDVDIKASAFIHKFRGRLMDPEKIESPPLDPEKGERRLMDPDKLE